MKDNCPLCGSALKKTKSFFYCPECAWYEPIDQSKKHKKKKEKSKKADTKEDLEEKKKIKKKKRKISKFQKKKN